jgi:glycosyltransferase involved in cell wall biosynthesis
MKILLIPDHTHIDWSAYNRCKALKKHIREYDFDIVGGIRNQEQIEKLIPEYDIIHFNYTGKVDQYYEILERKDAFKKTVLTIINERSLLQGYSVDLPRLEKLIKSVAYVTSVSRKIAEEYHCKFIPNGVDLEIFKGPKRLVVGFVGNPAENKGFFDLAKVCEELGLRLERFTFQGDHIPHDSMPDWYRSLDVFVHPSLTEGCSNVVLEAMAMDVPVIMRRSGIWKDLQGITIIDDGYEPLYNALREFRNKNQVKTRKFIETNYRWGEISKQYAQVYDEVARRRH